MRRNFHDKAFDEGTQLKLDIFRRYIREWLPVFITESSYLRRIASVNIFDFFSGPGYDAEGNPGTPVIIVEEIKKYCEEKKTIKSNIPIYLYFNDLDTSKVQSLKKELESISCKKGCCEIVLLNDSFEQCFEKSFSFMSDFKSANLVIMDQCGISDVTPEIVRRLSDCARTDILFFMPSAFIHRFKNHPAFTDKINLSGQNVEYNTIHRVVCEYYREMLGNREYYLAPFSIKSGRRIHGIIFGSGHLYGLEKFLKVCWAIDSTTGEANYNIDRDPSWSGQQYIFPEMNVIKRVDLFERELKEFIETKCPNNLDVYRFVLTNGFSPSRAREVLKKMEKKKWLTVETLIDEGKRKRGSFYLNHNEINARIQFIKSEDI